MHPQEMQSHWQQPLDTNRALGGESWDLKVAPPATDGDVRRLEGELS